MWGKGEGKDNKLLVISFLDVHQTGLFLLKGQEHPDLFTFTSWLRARYEKVIQLVICLFQKFPSFL